MNIVITIIGAFMMGWGWFIYRSPQEFTRNRFLVTCILLFGGIAVFVCGFDALIGR